MAKIRVYELARNFNMTNKALLEKMREIDITVKSHLSALDDDVVARIKQNILGVKEKGVEETRIKSTIIRRRPKHVPEKPVEVKAAAEPKVRPEKTEAGQEPLEAIVAEKEAPLKTEPQTAAQAAKIKAKEFKKTDIAKKVIDKKEVVKQEVPKTIDVPAGVDQPAAMQKKAQQVVQPVVSKLKRQPLAKKVKPKKIKKETPAKIIKLPAKTTPDWKPVRTAAPYKRHPMASVVCRVLNGRNSPDSIPC